MASRTKALRAPGLGLAAWLLLAGSALAQPIEVRVPDLETSPLPVTATVGGEAFVNHGLVAVARLPAATTDFAGDTIGGFSSLQIAQWRRSGAGYSGVLLMLPDRGPNDVGTIHGTSDYHNRVQTLAFSLRLGAAPRADLTLTGGFLLRDQAGATFTGLDPGTGVLTRQGIAYPSPPAAATRHISLDSEGLARLADGSFYVSDEYGAMVYYFDGHGRQRGAIAPPAALTPRTGGELHFTAADAPQTGRRNNQGLEAVAVTPDGRRLVTILQSATMQDSGAGAQSRRNTRVLVYDISRTRSPTAPIAEYVLPLPVYRTNGDGGAPDATAGQSEAIALSDHRFLVLSRDSAGRGTGSTRPIMFKSVLLVDTAGATNLAGTPYETGVQPVNGADGGLLAGINPASVTPFVNILDPASLGRFGLNLNTQPSDIQSIPEKLEGMALAPTLDPAAPDDVFLMIGDDNDFASAHGRENGAAFDAGLHGSGGAGDNDVILLVYRLTLPGAHRLWP